MPRREVCFEADEDLYRRLVWLRRRGFSTSEILARGIEAIERSLGASISYRPCGVREPFAYRWPGGGVERFERAECYDALVYGRRHRFYIAYGYRWAFGEDRRRVSVFLEKGVRRSSLYPLVEFTGTDRYGETREVASFIRRPDRRFMRVGEASTYPEYSQLSGYIREHSAVIRGGRRGLAALVVSEDDLERIILHAVIQGKWRGKL